MELQSSKKTEGSFGSGGHTFVLASDEVNPIAEVDLEADVAHEVLQANARDDPRPIADGIPDSGASKRVRLWRWRQG